MMCPLCKPCFGNIVAPSRNMLLRETRLLSIRGFPAFPVSPSCHIPGHLKNIAVRVA